MNFKKMRSSIRLVFFVMLGLFGCEQKKETDGIKKYVFLGHTYDWMGQGVRIDPRIEELNLKNFDQVWLGGDMCAETTREKSTLNYLDDHFDLSSPNTHWAIGNHDFRNGNTHFISETTHRPLFYSAFQDGITIIVLDAFMEHPFYLDSCDYKQRQYEFVQGVLDTIQHSSHAILLMHNVIWSDVDAQIEQPSMAAANAPGQWMDMLCNDRSKFSQLYYPSLLELQNTGVQVIIISGDGGQYHKGYKKKTSSGIEFYISGINNSVLNSNDEKLIGRFNTQPDSILIFTHNLIEQALEGQFVELNNYLKHQN